MSTEISRYLDEVAAAAGYTIDWDAAADRAAVNPGGVRRWLRLAAQLTATGVYKELLDTAWTSLQHTIAVNGLDADLPSSATLIHTITCEWLSADTDWPALAAGFTHLGTRLSVMTPLPGPATPGTAAPAPATGEVAEQRAA